MIAIVFCASLAPWLKATKPLEKSWSLRNAPFARLGRALRKRLRSTTVSAYASTSPAIGDVTKATKTGTTSPHRTAPTPYAASPMPISAPINACEELEGRPARQVKRFHTIAPKSTATSIDIATPPSGATRLPTVLATSAWRSCVVTIAPTRFSAADRPTARRGGNARVPIAVPMAFAVSWKPLVKSKKSATAMVRTRRSACASGILGRDALQHVRHGFAAVEGVLQETVKILELDDLQRRMLTAEELGDGPACRRVASVLQPVDLGAVLVDPLARLEFADRLLELHDRQREKPRQLTRRLGDDHNPVQVGRIGDLLDVVEDVVQTRREGVDVLMVEWGHESPIEGEHDLVRDLVTPVLEGLDLPLTRREVGHVGKRLLEQAGRADDRRGLLLEEVVEAPF